MARLRLSYANIEHGGCPLAGYTGYTGCPGDAGPIDCDRVVGVLHDDDWPDIFAMGEGARRPALRSAALLPTARE